MNNIGEQINLVINNLADKLGVTTDKLYPILIKQAHIDGMLALFWSIIGVLILGITSYLVYRYYIQEIEVNRYGDIVKETRSKNWQEMHVVAWIIIILGLCWGMIEISSINDCIVALNNPEWYAIKMILGQLK